MEYVFGGDLGRYIFERGLLYEYDVKFVVGQFVDVLSYFYVNNIIY